MEHIYEKGTIKVVWMEVDVNRIYSKMFNDMEDAKLFAHDKQDYLIFALIKQKNMEQFEWELVRAGRYDLYSKLMTYYKRHKGSIDNILKLLR